MTAENNNSSRRAQGALARINDIDNEMDENDIQDSFDMEYSRVQQYCEDSEPTSVSLKSNKEKQKSKRIKLKEEIINANNKAIARQPCYYKFDSSTSNILHRLVDLYKAGEFHEIAGRGRNSVVIHASSHRKARLSLCYGNAVKVYKLSNNIEQNKVIYNKVQREYECLQELHNRNGFWRGLWHVPWPLYKYKNVIVMGFIGSEQETAMSISNLAPEKLLDAYNEIVNWMVTWYWKEGLVHGSISERKLLWIDLLCVIGWSHAVKKDHPMALKKLMRDCQFVFEENHFIVIIVTSHVKHVKMRNLLRAAMPRVYLQSMNTIRLFLLGKIPPNEQFITQNAIQDENKTFGDILQGSFLEIYRNLPFKILMGLQWAAHTCNDASYILKADDDTIFNLERTYTLLTSTKMKDDFLMGYMFNNSKPQRDNESKWYVTWEEYPRNDYPPYLSGWYYITTPNTALRLTSEAAYHPYLWIEDILITGLLTEALKIRLVQLPEGYM